MAEGEEIIRLDWEAKDNNLLQINLQILFRITITTMSQTHNEDPTNAQTRIKMITMGNVMAVGIIIERLVPIIKMMINVTGVMAVEHGIYECPTY